MRSAARLCAAAAVIALSAACGSVPAPAMPDGRSRTPINDQASIDQYMARAARDTARTSEDGATLRQIDALKRDIATLKRYLAAGMADADGAPARTRRTPANGGAFVTASKAHPAGPAGRREALELRQQSIVFRIAHGVAESAFLPSPQMQEVLLRAARAARRIEIRGRSDGALGNDTNQRIALARAQQARQYLLKHGIAAAKIRLSYLAAGGFIADNATEAGRASNRRVEIEAMDLPTESFAKSGNLTEGRLP